MTNAKRPLDGIRVLDIATFIAAPYACAILGEFGAEVIKVEQPQGGDSFRRFGSITGRDGDSLMWLSEARNKESVTLDLRKPEGRELFLKLVARTDVIAENFRPGTLEKWGLGWEELRRANPGLILLRISGYGQTGPYKDRPGFARIAHAFGGLSYLAGMPGDVPVTPGSTSLADYMSGLYGAIGVLLALRHKDATGEGQIIDLALYESVFRALDEIAPAFAMFGKVREREGSGTVNACPHGHFRCGDGKWVALACTTDRMFARLCEAMERPELAEEAKWGLLRHRLAERVDVDALVGHWIAGRPRETVMALCLDFEVPAAPLNTIADIFEDPQFQARGNLQEVADAVLGSVVVPGVVPKLSATPGRVEHLGPRLGEGNGRVYGGLLGLGKAEIEALKEKGVI
ncbi:L-carnitine dehydratase/bile acid-inducible protein F [Paramagnetospirillum magnetotacticum MS-1]|uniref:L-carnitine dehydratase/bile acid-inducible protein F n=1 Tax=Paramagnetospirillum magnetotacticum MS-1 TaxID=272627 RepID=A0A0C2V0G4_PARME|nr:CoA transferase [Paramagnetospirillum magnetotacticum]KIL98581.1 L-carnitine dehydratase/bile acid-inducible protein F [Paramagnetospirillum magnetotacticum MS-1]